MKSSCDAHYHRPSKGREDAKKSGPDWTPPAASAFPLSICLSIGELGASNSQALKSAQFKVVKTNPPLTLFMLRENKLLASPNGFQVCSVPCSAQAGRRGGGCDFLCPLAGETLQPWPPACANGGVGSGPTQTSILGSEALGSKLREPLSPPLAA